jgi:hypothetical protein
MAGEPDVDGMLRRLSARQFRRWMLYEQVEPFGQLREDYRAAMVASHVANTGYDTSKRGPFKIEDFLLKFGSEERALAAGKVAAKQSPEEQASILNMLAVLFGGLEGK